MLKNTFFSYKIKIEIKATTATVIKSDLKYSPMPEGNTCITDSNLELLPLIIDRKTYNFQVTAMGLEPTTT